MGSHEASVAHAILGQHQPVLQHVAGQAATETLCMAASHGFGGESGKPSMGIKASPHLPMEGCVVVITLQSLAHHGLTV